MIIEHKKTWGYKCPHCTEDVLEEIGLFDVTSYQPFASSCPICKTLLGTISKDVNGDYVIEAPCYVCQETHVFRVPHKLFWNQQLFSLGCTLSGYDICYFGEKSEVEDSLKQLNEEILKRYEISEGILDEYDERIRQALDILQERTLSASTLPSKTMKCVSGYLLATLSAGSPNWKPNPKIRS